MKEVELHINKGNVWLEVLKNTEYIGTKVLSETDVYDTIRMTDEDTATLPRLWDEAVAVANEKLKEMLYTQSSDDEGYNVSLLVANAYDTNLNDSVDKALTAYFVATLTAKWMRYSNQDEAQKYADMADGMMNEVLTLLFSRMRPHRPPVEVIE